MSPFRIRWAFTSPAIVPTLPIHLDGLLSWARVQRAIARGADDPIAEQHDLPLAKHEAPGGWCFKASWIDFRLDPEVLANPEMLHMVKRSSVTEISAAWESGVLGDKVPYFDPQRGLHKAGSFIHRRQWFGEAVAYGVGDIDAVRDLLSEITSIGKLRRRANGSVKLIEIIEDQDAARLWARRVLPSGSDSVAVEPMAGMLSPLRAPYWKRENAVTSLVPIAA